MIECFAALIAYLGCNFALAMRYFCALQVVVVILLKFLVFDELAIHQKSTNDFLLIVIEMPKCPIKGFNANLVQSNTIHIKQTALII